MSDVRSGMVIAGKYRLEAILARGGMGSVWKARHLTLDAPLALKFISAEVFALPEARKRFEREAKAAALLQSPHVVQIHDYGVESNLPYLVMELLSGEDLGARLKRTERLSPEETAGIVVQVARALRRAAEAGIVHRDLKPSNVFLVGGEDEDLVKVLDFGIAKAPRELRSDDESTKRGAIIGSPRYMSPEQARGSPLVDPRSDLWSLAVIAYRAVTGELPFKSNDMTDLIVKICSETPVPPSQIDPDLGPDMDAFFVRALDRDPARRFQTARELAVAFALASGAPPPSQGSFRLLGRFASGEHRALDAAVASFAPAPPGAETRDAAPPSSKRSFATASTPPRPPAPSSPDRRDAGELGTSSPQCDPTRISGRPPAPAGEPAPGEPAEAAPPRRISPVPKGTPTPYPSGVDVPPIRSAYPLPPALARRLAIAAGIAALLVSALIALAPWHHDGTTPVVADGAAAPPEPITPRSALPAEPQDPAFEPKDPTFEPKGQAIEPQDPAIEPPTPPSGAPSAAKPPRPPPPANRLGPKRKHSILGI